MQKVISNEPVIAAILAVVAATIALLIAFNVHISAGQREAIEGWVGAVLALGFLVRSRVTPKTKQPAPSAGDVSPTPPAGDQSQP